jgi:hypothetical protein
MENFKLHSAKIVGTPTGKSGSWVHTFSPADPQKVSQRGHLLAVIGLDNFIGEGELAVVGKEIISRLHEEYYGELTTKAFDQLKRTVNKVVQEINESGDLSLNLGAVVVINNLLYVVMNHGSQLKLLRQGQIKTIFSEEETGSGYLKNEDVLLLGTEEFFRLVNQEIISSALASSSPEEAVEILAPAIHGQADGSSAGIVFKMAVLKKEAAAKVPLTREEGIAKEKRSLGLGLGKKLKEKIVSLIVVVDESLKKRMIYLRNNKEKNFRSQRTLFSVALILLVILGVSVFFGMKQRRGSDLTGQAAVLLSQAQDKKEEGEALKTLNPAKSQQLLTEAQNLVGEIEKLGGQSEDFLKFKEELNNLLAGSLREHEIEGSFFFDLGLIKAGAEGKNLLLADEKLIVLDEKQTAVYEIGLTDQKSTILFGGEKIQGADLIAQAGGNFYVLTGNGLLKGGKLPEIEIEKDEDWGRIIDMEGFSGNLYLLDTQGEIWKYPAIEGGFGEKQDWLQQKADFSSAVSLTIDGSLWVLTKDGQILRFLQGQKDPFILSGLNKPLFEPSVIFTDFDSQNLYLLDKGNSRIVVFSKNGEYQAEYHWPELNQVQDLVVVEAEKKIFCLMGSKVYLIEMP